MNEIVQVRMNNWASLIKARQSIKCWKRKDSEDYGYGNRWKWQEEDHKDQNKITTL